MSGRGSAEPRLVVLTGLPGAGKSTVGPLVAARLGWRWLDLDAEIAHAAGRPIAEVFAADGESGFREWELRVTRALADAQQVVVSVGGGWGVEPATRNAIGPNVITVYLRVSPSAAIARMAGTVAARPLLRTDDPEATLGQLLARRETSYLQANHTLAVDALAPDAAADIIVALVRRSTGD